MTNEREIVLDSLIEIIEKDSFSHLVEKAVLDKYDYLESNQKGFIKRVIEGTIENLDTIDGVIDRYAKTKVARQKPLIRTLLRMSTYQILYMDKVPDSAVCNEAVKLAGKRGFRTLSGFVNGVLRSISRDKNILNVKDEISCPQWIIDHLTNCYGVDVCKAVLSDMKKEKPVTVRIRRPIEDMSVFLPCENMKDAYTVKKGVSVKDIPGYENGDFVVQDTAGMAVGYMSGIKPGDIVLDVCAAPGGKAVHAADLGGVVEARDISEYKVSLIEDNFARCKVENAKAKVWDATVPDKSWEKKADVVILDAPCSGLGVMSRKSDIKYKTHPEDLAELEALQRKIIDTVYGYVKEGGVLMYSTCTLNPGENDEQARYITNNYPFVLEEEKQFIQGIDATDGFYIARLRRKSENDGNN